MNTPKFNLFSSLWKNTNRPRILHSPPSLDATHREEEKRENNHRDVHSWFSNIHHCQIKHSPINLDAPNAYILDIIHKLGLPVIGNNYNPTCKIKIDDEVTKIETINQSFFRRVAYIENNIGVNLANGKKLPESIDHFVKAANQENINAKYNLALCKFVDPTNKYQAIKLWKELESKGHSSATYQLAVCYLRGDVVKKDKNRGLKLMDKAALLNSPDANFYFLIKSIKENKMDHVKRYSQKVKHNVAIREKLHQIMEMNGFPNNARTTISSVLDS